LVARVFRGKLQRRKVDSCVFRDNMMAEEGQNGSDQGLESKDDLWKFL